MKRHDTTDQQQFRSNPWRGLEIVTRAAFDHFRSAEALTNSPLIHWLDENGLSQQSKPDRYLQVAGIDRAMRVRGGGSHQGKRNHEGNYWFARLGRHVWFESAAEKHALMALDFAVPVRAVVPQPLHISFEDGTSHTPDYYVLTSDMHGLLIDIHLRRLTDERDELHFRRTAQICREIGWSYLLLEDMPSTQRLNLDFLATYRLPEWRPSEVDEGMLVRFTQEPRAIGAIREEFRDVRGHQGALYHLMWNRRLLFAVGAPLTDLTWVTAV